MRKQEWKHEGVKPNGTFYEEEGQVNVDGGITFSHPKGGCGLENCKCSEGHWICVAQPRTEDGIVQGYTLFFDDGAKMNEFLLSSQYLEIEERFNN